MRAIGSYEDAEQRRQKTVRNFCFFLLFILIFSSIGYAFLSNPDASTATTSQDTGVRQLGSRWVFGPAGAEVALTYSPEETANITVGQLSNLEAYVGEPLFLDVPNPGALQEVAGAFQNYPSRMQEACYGNCDRDLPEKDCSNNLIVWRESTNASVRQENECVFIDGDLRAVDAFIYEMFNIPRENL